MPPIAERFRELTHSRYGALDLGPNLETHGIHAAGERRDVSLLSMGTREQLSTLFRLSLAEKLGSLVGQLAHDNLTKIAIEVEGAAAQLNVKPITAAVLAGLMRRYSDTVNMVNAPFLAKERGMAIARTTQDRSGTFDAYIKVTMVTDKRDRSVAGTCFSDGKPRFIQIKGINIDAEIGEHMLYTTNEDVPGIIGLLGMTMGKNGVNIANFTLGRSGVGQDAIAILYLDQAIDPKVLDTLEATGMFQQVKALQFDVA